MSKILIIDDEKSIHASLLLILGKNNYGIDSAFDEKEALSKLGDNDFKLLICDYNLGNTKGTDLVIKARQKGYQGKIIMMTCDPEIKDFYEDFQKEILTIVEKPFQDIFEFKKNIELFMQY